MIRVEGIKTFEELLAKHGKGYGCEVCKPTVGSAAGLLLERIHSEAGTYLRCRILNDNFLANIQKRRHLLGDPAFSGGEITRKG